MEILKGLIFVFLGVATLTDFAHAQTQSGFISIDCGLFQNSGYTDKKTGINYTSDVNFTEAGVNYNISSEYSSSTLEQPFLTVRSFPDGIKNCYTLKPALGYIKFLIRASFMYGNYDGQNILPRFDLLLGADEWDTVELGDASTVVSKEIIHFPLSNYIHVCLVNKGLGTPFISSLELRPVRNSSYPIGSGTSLLLYSRLDVGSTANSNATYRFKDDVYDRIWSPYTRSNWARVNTSLEMEPCNVQNLYQPPLKIMQTAAVPANGNDSLLFDWKPSDPTLQFYAYFYFAELNESEAFNQSRKQNIYLNGRLWHEYSFRSYLVPDTIYNTTPISGEKLEFEIRKAEESQLPPILNALELYQSKQLPQLLTSQQDVEAIMNIKTKYEVKRNWQGDPCVPLKYLWRGLNCSSPDSNNSPRITSLNLSSSGISGDISPHISGLTLIRSLDLSNNNLTGRVPYFLVELSSLTILNLRGNNLQGSVPAELCERSRNGLLELSVDGNPDHSLSTSCTKKKNIVVPVLASFLALTSILVAALSTQWILKTRSQGVFLNNQNNMSLELTYPKFLYSDVARITNNFERVIGKSEFGTVYHGNLNDTQVAVNMLSQSSIQGYEQFQAEVKHLMRVHHKNLTSLLGYCDDGNIGLISEFMTNGNLETHLLDQENSTAAADVLDQENSTPADVLAQEYSNPADALDQEYSTLADALDQENSTPADVLDQENSTPADVLNQEYSTPADALDQENSTAADVLDQEITPADALDQENSTPADALDQENSTAANVLSWEGRLRIATDAAQGLQHLHSGCKRPIIHGVLKLSNILLNENFQAKIADFGISQFFPVQSEAQVSTNVAGTSGYLDPKYCKSNKLTGKNDVYSFGVVLLQLITSKPAFDKSRVRPHIAQWVSLMVAKGHIKNVVDPRLRGEDLDMNSVRRAVKVAMACVSQASAKRPTMNRVVSDLTEILETEVARKMDRQENDFSVNPDSDSSLIPSYFLN